MKRHVVIIIVEGKTDFTVINKILQTYTKTLPLIGSPIIKVFYTIGDRLTKWDETTGKYRLDQDCLDFIAEGIKDLLEKWLNDVRNPVTLKDITSVWFLTDMDGICIPDSSIRLNPDLNPDFNLTYTENEILAKYKDDRNAISDAIGRNKRKRRNINYILQGHQISLKADGMTTAVPIFIYYMSTNLEHVTVNIRQANKNDKENLADKWCNEIASNGPQAIKDFFSNLLPCKPTYERSWQYIMEYGTYRTLRRSSNIRLVLDSLATLSYDNGQNKRR